MELSSFRLFVLGCLFISLPSFLLAQSIAERKVNGNFQQASLSEVVRSVEQSAKVKVYYQTDKLPTKKYSLNFNQTALGTVLDQLTEGTDLSYMYYRDFAVVLIPKIMQGELYSANYYRALEQSLNSDERANARKQQINVGDITQLRPSGQAKISGQILDDQTKDPIIGATVFFTDLNSGTSTDADGRFELDLATGKHEILIQYVGYDDILREVMVYSDGAVELEMRKAAVDLEEVLVRAEAADANVSNAQIGVDRLDVKTIKKIPAFLGEADVVKSLLLNPGVSSIGEGATGFNVRGGEVDQNLMLQDEGFIFNASHALGFFSTFNADLINGVELYKGNIPAQFGGRLASVLDIEMRDGDFDKFRLKGGVGPVSGRLSLEGPLAKGKTSFLVGARSSYSDWVLNQINVLEVANSSAFFYDVNARLTHRFNEKNSIVLSGYLSQDDFTYNQEFGFDYITQMGQLEYRKIFNDKFFSKTTVVASTYASTQTDLDSLDAATLDTEINYIKAKELLTYTSDNGMKFDGGVEGVFYLVEPGKSEPFGSASTIIPKTLESERALEASAFANLEYPLTAGLTVSAGLRFTQYQQRGPKTVFQYAEGVPISEETIVGVTEYGKGDVISSYNSIEPRFSMVYKFTPDFSVKAGYSRTSQFINQIFNSDSPTPTSQFQLSNEYIKPFRSHNVSLGFYKNFEDNNWETSIEGYGRQIDELFDFKDFAQLAVNEHIETELLSGEGRAYGAEVSIKKKKGTVNGWMSYTASKTERLIEGINDGEWYNSNFDQPHNLSLILNFQPNQRHTFTVNFNYNTGRPATPPLGNYKTPNGLNVPVYSKRNQFRIPDYHRLDIAYTIGQGYNQTKKFKTSWTFSIYNVYGRRNAFSVYYTQGLLSAVQANQLSVLGSMFPSITFNFQTI